MYMYITCILYTATKLINDELVLLPFVNIWTLIKIKTEWRRMNINKYNGEEH